MRHVRCQLRTSSSGTPSTQTQASCLPFSWPLPLARNFQPGNHVAGLPRQMAIALARS